jgi:L-ascorbate metabolism protein UlaG (beta-lactamase superfamily)
MDITWLGHAGFRIKSGSVALVMDPFPDTLGLRLPPQHSQANVVTISGDEPNRSAADVVTGDKTPVVINGPGEYEAAGLRIKGVRTPAFAADGETAWNTVYVIEWEGLIICHLGDPGRLLSGHELEELGSPHILIIPVGSKTGFSPADAVETVNSISPRITIPTLYAHAGNKNDLREVTPFLQEFGASTAETHNRVSVTRANLPEEATVTLLEPVGVLI